MRREPRVSLKGERKEIFSIEGMKQCRGEKEAVVREMEQNKDQTRLDFLEVRSSFWLID
jgi:hypothetical protein